MGCRGCLARLGLFIFNFIFLVSGFAVIFVGMLTKNNVIQHIVTLDSNESAFNTAATVLIIFGVVILMFAAFGFFFVCLPKRCSGGKQLFGGLYIIFLSLVLIGELGGEIAAAVFKGKLDDQLPDILKKSLGSNYKEGNNLQAKAWDFVQVMLTCCGSKGPQDYYGTSFNNTNRHVPDTCCVLTNKDPEHPNVKNYFECQFEAYQIQHNVTSNSSDFIHQEGCFTSFESQINGHLAQIVGVGVAIVMLELLGIVLVCYVCRKGDDNDPYNDKRSKERSHNRNRTRYPPVARRTPYTARQGDLNYEGGVDNETNSDASNDPDVDGPDDYDPDVDGPEDDDPDVYGKDVDGPDDDVPDVKYPWFETPSSVRFDHNDVDRILREMPSSLRDELNTQCSWMRDYVLYEIGVDDVMRKMPSSVRDELENLCYQMHIDVSDDLIRQILSSVHDESKLFNKFF